MKEETIVNHQDNKLTNQFNDEHTQWDDNNEQPKQGMISKLIDCFVLANLKLAICLPSLIIVRYMGLELFLAVIVLAHFIWEFLASYKDANQKLEDFAHTSLSEIISLAVKANSIVILGACIAFGLKELLAL
jgi:hypothetical protein